LEVEREWVGWGLGVEMGLGVEREWVVGWG
jgi:hypothetical protein